MFSISEALQQPIGPVVWWQPVEGERHALPPHRRPHPGEERETLCERRVTLIDPTDVDWLCPTCDVCMVRARERVHEREDRRHGTRSRGTEERQGPASSEDTGEQGSAGGQE